MQAGDALFHGGGQIVMNSTHVGEFRIGADRRDDASGEERIGRIRIDEGAVRVPELVGLAPLAAAVGFAQDAMVLVKVGDVIELGAQARRLALGATVIERIGQIAKLFTHGDLLVI